MKSMNIARKFYPRLRYLRINISRLLATLLQVVLMQTSAVQSVAVPVIAASLVGWRGHAHADASTTGNVSGAYDFLTNGFGSAQLVNSGGVATSQQIRQGLGQTQEQHISSGGLAVSTNVYGSGIQMVSSGGLASATTLGSSGVQNISSGGIASNTTVSSGGIQNISKPAAVFMSWAWAVWAAAASS